MDILNGLVLTGGKSSRMGSDKGGLVYARLPQLEHLFHALSTVCDNVYFSDAKDAEPRPNAIRDRFDIKGPMNGILSAFHQSPDSAWLIVAVDMPLVDENVLKFLKVHRDRSKIATCFYNEQERFPEPLLTLWEPAAFPLLQKFYNAGRISPRDFLKKNDINLLLPEDPKILLNINTPEDFQKFRDLPKD